MNHLLSRLTMVLIHLLMGLNLYINIGCTHMGSGIGAAPINGPAKYWLKVSMYGGQFYDDDKRMLLDPRPFAFIDDAKTLDGYTIYPPKETETIPAGTLVEIADITYPSTASTIKPLFLPHDNIWIFLKVAKERGRVNLFNDQIYILLAPKILTNASQLKGFLNQVLTNRDPNEWILRLERHIRQGIYDKRPVIGMAKEHLLAALGPPNKKQVRRSKKRDEQREIWHYDDYFIIFNHSGISKIKKL